MKTLRDLVNENPGWLDLPLVVYMSDGRYDWLSGSDGLGAGSAYKAETCGHDTDTCDKKIEV